MDSIVLNFGTNVGKREQNLLQAQKLLMKSGISIIRTSSVYETEPFGYSDQPFFLNQVLIVATTLTPKGLLKTCLEVEDTMGRIRTIKDGPRIIDIDLLYYHSEVVNDEDLQLPHPGIPTRRAVLTPLAQLIADQIDPQSGKTIAQLVDECPDTLIVKPHQNSGALSSFDPEH
ncbi:MAG: 2-amino-4-hydroxy-6-hydroxymethyldihydropteridine diphosphokinase [bacterium]|nr:2-amino-4-hydroxy-6-hydroxymethyldihydropteridine diphosphokinase [bacterium]